MRVVESPIPRGFRIRNLIHFAVLLTLCSATANGAQPLCPSDPGLFQVVDIAGKAAFINPKGEFVLTPSSFPEKTVLVHWFYEGLAAVGVNLDNRVTPPAYSGGITKFGYIDLTGKFVIEPQFDYGYPFCGGLALVSKGEFLGYIDRSGKVVIDLKKDCNEDLPTGIKRGRCPTRRAGELFVDEESEGLIAVSDGRYGFGSKYGFNDTRGRIVIKPRFEPEREPHGSIRSLSKFIEGRAKVKLGGLYGFIDKKGHDVIPARFTRANDFSEGLAFVATQNGEFGYINKHGDWVIRGRNFIDGGNFCQGLAPIAVHSTDSKRREPIWGYIDRRGRIIIGPRFDHGDEFRNGVARIYEIRTSDDRWESRFGYIDKAGKYLWKPGSRLTSVDKTANR